MKQNQTLKSMLAAYRPDLGRSDQYLADLDRRLQAIEPVKRMYESERRQMRSRMVVSFVSGGVTGVAATIRLLLHPVAVLTPSRHLSDSLAANANILLTVLFILAFSVMVAIICTQTYQILKKDYRSPTTLN